MTVLQSHVDLDPRTRDEPPDRDGSRHLTPAQLTELRTMLEQQRAFRRDQLTQLRRTQRLGLVHGDVEDEITRSLVSGARSALHDVLDALRRMDAGCYGTCRECHRTIPLERLEILPQLTLCMHCQRAGQLAPV